MSQNLTFPFSSKVDLTNNTILPTMSHISILRIRHIDEYEDEAIHAFKTPESARAFAKTEMAKKWNCSDEGCGLTESEKKYWMNIALETLRIDGKAQVADWNLTLQQLILN